MGNRLQAKAVESLDKGHRVTARSELLRAAKYYAQALYWVLGTATPDAEKATYTALDDSFRAALALMEPAPEELEVSYGSHRLPAWLLRPSDDGTARPTIILNNGSDGQHVDLLVQGGYAALERGYNVVIFEGPGQGSMIFVHNVPFTHEWQEVITPIVDVLVERSDVDAERIALRGISFGGLLCPWAAAHEHRLAALVADPGSTSSWLDYPEVVRNTAESDDPEEVNRLWREMIIPASTPEQLFALKKTLEIFSSEAHDEVMAGGYPTDWFSLSRTIQDYDLSGVAERIECPTLVTLYEGDTAFKDEPRKLFDMLRTEHRELVEFTSVDGAQYHCGPMAPQVSNEACWDWLDETFGR
jgi:dienelactone hydrolase